MSTTTTVKKLYLAPANHYNALRGYNRKDAVRTALQAFVQERLSAYDGTAVYHTTVVRRTAQARRGPPRWRRLLHRAPRQRLSGTDSGAQTFYHPRQASRSKALAAAIAES